MLITIFQAVFQIYRHRCQARYIAADVHAIANYRAVDLGRKTFFERAFTPGKEAAASLGFARIIGREAVLGDLHHLHASLGCPCDERAAA